VYCRVLQAVEMLKPPQLSNEKSDEHPDFTSRIGESWRPVRWWVMKTC